LYKAINVLEASTQESLLKITFPVQVLNGGFPRAPKIHDQRWGSRFLNYLALLRSGEGAV